MKDSRIAVGSQRTTMEQRAERTDVIDGFGDEWNRFDQTGMTEEERLAVFEGYAFVPKIERHGQEQARRSDRGTPT